MISILNLSALNRW